MGGNDEETRQLEATYELEPSAVSYRLFVRSGEREGRSVLLQQGRPSIIGSSVEASLTLPDPAVSRLHLRVTLAGDGVTVEDLGSTNGSKYEGQSFTKMTLRPGTTITVGTTALQLVVESEQEAPSTSTATSFGGLIGRSPKMRAVFALLERAATNDATVLITGETGTGKEVAAEAIHRRSVRADKPFVVVDCASIPKNLFESELFGHQKGAFTGASEDRRGAFLEADGGTIFFDEVAELPIDVQPRLLRALESRTVKPVGGDERHTVDVRVLAATHRALDEAIEQGQFRADLFFRLAVLKVELPPLRERREDIVVLARHFAEQQGDELALSPELSAAMLTHNWPGNVRELRNVVQQASSLSRKGIEIALELSQDTNPLHEVGGFGLEAYFDLPFREARARAIETFEKGYARYNLERAEDDVVEAANKTGLSKAALLKMID